MVRIPPNGRAGKGAAPGELPAGLKEWGLVWRAFLASAHAALIRRCRQDRPIYRLRGRIVEALAGAKGRRQFLSAADAHAERAFAAMCGGWGPACIGVWHEAPVIYSLDPLPFAFPDALVRAWRAGDWSFEEKRRRLQVLERALSNHPVHRQRRRRVGELLCDRGFLEERDAIRAQWSRLQPPPDFPLDRRSAGAAPEAGKGLPGDRAEFHVQFKAFLDRWELAAMTTWDLPSPLGAMEAMPASAFVNLLGDPVIENVHPQSEAVPIAEASRVGRLILPGAPRPPRRSAPRAGAPGDLERVPDMLLAEIALRSRYGWPRGATARLSEAFEIYFDLTLKRVEQVRARYRPVLDHHIP